MKKVFTIAAIAAATILAGSCAKEFEGEIQKEGIIAHASLQPVEATKAIGEYSYNIVWEENDKITVLDNTGNKASFKLTAGEGTTTGTFQQEGSDALTAPLTAYYPASVVAEDKSHVWPATQADVKNISNVPMTAESSTATGDVNFAFKHLGSVLQLVLTAKNGTINVKQIDITADQGLSGAFTVENGTAKISSTGTTITTGDISDKNIKLSAAASYLNFAVPSGSFTNFKITITDINDKTYSLSAASLTLNHAMVNKVTFAMDAKNPAVFELNVNGHTVRVTLADAIDINKDIMLSAYVEGNSVIVNAWPKSSRHLKCTMYDGELCTSQSKTSNMIYTFIISDITSDTTATIGYAEKIVLPVTPLGAGSVEIIGEDYEGETVTLKAMPGHEYGFYAWLDKDGNPLSCEEETYSDPVRLSSGCMGVSFKYNLVLDGIFTVADDGNGNVKRVHFTRGNLYCSGALFDDNGRCTSISDAQWLIEQHQYDFGEKGKRDQSHISHFMWCVDSMRSLDLRYDATGTTDHDVLFTNSGNFTVSGLSAGQCRVLTNDEWSYLFSLEDYDNDIRRNKYKAGVKVCGSANCVVILPDNWEGDTTIKGEYSYVEWKDMEAAGAVCLPAAGSRQGFSSYDPKYDPEIVNYMDQGWYWSASLYDSGILPLQLFFVNSIVSTGKIIGRDDADAVRLVEDVKE